MGELFQKRTHHSAAHHLVRYSQILTVRFKIYFSISPCLELSSQLGNMLFLNCFLHKTVIARYWLGHLLNSRAHRTHQLLADLHHILVNPFKQGISKDAVSL